MEVISRRSRLLISVCLTLLAASLDAAPITIRVDATEASSNLLHSHLTIPATPGSLTLYYPKWIPGEHGTTGPVVYLDGIGVTASGAAIPWTRDPIEMYAFRVDVPAGATAIDVDLDYLAPALGEKITAGAS